MTKYYKGKVRETNFNEQSYKLDIVKCKVNGTMKYFLSDRTSKDLYSFFKNYSSDELEKLDQEIYELTTIKADEYKKRQYTNLLSKAFKLNANLNPSSEKLIIYYQKVYDKDGNEYAREYVTNAIIPVNSQYNNYEIEFYNPGKYDGEEVIFFDKENGETYYISDGYLTDRRGSFLTPSIDTGKLRKLIFGEETSLQVGKRDVTLTVAKVNYYKFVVFPQMIFPNLKIQNIVVNETIATPLEIQDFKELISGPRGTRNKSEYEQQVKKCASSNYLGEDFDYFDVSPTYKRIKEDNVTKAMQDLEYRLSKLKTISKANYALCNEQYQQILSGKVLNEGICEKILLLQNKVDLVLLCGAGDFNGLFECIKAYIKQYLDNIKTGNKSFLSIKDLDIIIEGLLSAKKESNYLEINSILKYISLLYFFVMYEKCDSITVSMLENSYASDNIKRIIIAISELKEEKIIKYVPDNLFDISNVYELMDLIKHIEFNEYKDENCNKLIKKIQQ